MERKLTALAIAVFVLALGVRNLDAQFVNLAEVKAGKYDNGKMWTFDYPPVEHLKETYDFEPDAAWFEKARLGALRLPNCTASFVSPYGLVMTNHHCARTSIEAVSQGDEDLLKSGFTSMSLEDERRVPGLYVDQLIAVEDVTDEVYAALEGQETDAEKAAARTDAIAAITERATEAAGGADAGIVVQVINLYNGGRYSAYTFRRYSDVRLVMGPELQLGYFGGDTDNFTYPRYALDMSYLRVYEDGEPYQPEHYFQWSADGASEGDPVFVIGNPGSTLRLNTVAQLEWRRDVRAKVFVELFDSRIAALEEYYAEEPSSALLNRIFSLKNGQKLYRGRLKGLHNPVIMAKRIDNEQQFLNDLEAKYGSTVTEDVPIPYASIIDDLADIQQEKRDLTSEYSAFFLMTNTLTYSSATVMRAFDAVTYLNQQADGMSDERLAETAAQIKDVRSACRDQQAVHEGQAHRLCESFRRG